MHRVLRKAQVMNKEELDGLILERYSKVCGDYGRKIFEEKVLPLAYSLYSENSLIVMELFRLIQYAGEIKLSKLEEYLLGVVQNLERQIN